MTIIDLSKLPEKPITVDYKDFNFEKLVSTDLSTCSNGQAKEIKPYYIYEKGGDQFKSKVYVKGPEMKTSLGILDPWTNGDDKEKSKSKGKESIRVIFDESQNHKDFVGKCGNEHLYTEVIDDEGNTKYQRPENYSPVKTEGFLGELRNWCLETYAKKAYNNGKVNPAFLSKSVKDLDENGKTFFYTIEDKDDKSKKVAVKYLKLMKYEPLEDMSKANYAKVYIPKFDPVTKTTSLDQMNYPEFRELGHKRFSFIPYFYFRRIFIGNTKAITIEVTKLMITDIQTSVKYTPIHLLEDAAMLTSNDPSKMESIHSKVFSEKKDSDENEVPGLSEQLASATSNIQDIDEQTLTPVINALET